MTTRRTRWGALLAAPLLVGTLAACDPPPPPPVFHVDATDDRGDAALGDGVCATDVGTCTLNAAVEEANALGRAEVLVPPGDYDEFSGAVEGHVTVSVDTSEDPRAFATFSRSIIGIAPGGALVLRSLELGTDDESGILNGGTLVADRTAFAGQITVAPDATAVLQGSFAGRGVIALGQVYVIASTIVSGSAIEPALGLEGGAVTLGGAALLSPSGVPTCRVDEPGTAIDPVSIAPNLASDDSCNLTGPGDVNGSPDDDGALFPSPGSPRIDAIPVGTLGCGTTLVSDIRGAIRPTDGDGDGVAACDIGAWER